MLNKKNCLYIPGEAKCEIPVFSSLETIKKYSTNSTSIKMDNLSSFSKISSKHKKLLFLIVLL